MTAAALRVACILACLMLLAAGARGEEAAAVAAAPDTAVLPAVRFVGGVAGDELYNRLRQSPRFDKLSRESYGSPIELRVYHTFRSSAAGRVGGMVTGLLAASTLGVLPASNSGEHSIVYDIVVNGVVLTSFSYQKSFSRAFNIWSTDTTYGLGKEGLEWAESTVERFLKDSAADQKLADLLAEYAFYFPSAKPH